MTLAALPPSPSTPPTPERPTLGVRDQVRFLGSRTLVYGLGNIAGRLVGFLMLPLMTRYLRPSDYGLYSVLMLWSFAATSVCSYGLNAGIVGSWYFETSAAARRERVMGTVLLLLCASAVGLVILAVVGREFLASVALIGSQDSWLLSAVLTGTAVNLLAMPPSLRLMFDDRAPTFVAISGVASLLTVVLNLVMVVGLGRGVRGLVEAGLVAQTLATALFYLPRASRRLRLPDLGLARAMVSQSLPMVPAAGVLLLLQHGNKYVMQWFGQSEQLGIYSIGFNFGMFMQLPLAAFQSAWYPYFTSFVGKPEETTALFGRITTYYVLAFGGLSLLFYGAAKPVVLVMTQPAFHEAYVVVGLASTAQLLLSIHVLLLPGAYFAREFGIQTAIQTGALIVAGIACVALIPPYGLVGAALALLFGALAVLTFTMAWNWYRRDTYPRVSYERGRLARFAILYTLLVFLAVRPPASLGRELISSLVLLLAAAGSIYACLTRRERQMLSAFARGALVGGRQGR